MVDKTITRLHDVPKAKDKAVEFLKKTAELNGEMPYWRPNRSSWKTLLPQGVRPWPEVAVMDSSAQYVRNDYVLLRYCDGVKATIGTDKLYKGHVIYPGEVTKKWLVAEEGEMNIKHQIVGKES